MQFRLLNLNLRLVVPNPHLLVFDSALPHPPRSRASVDHATDAQQVCLNILISFAPSLTAKGNRLTCTPFSHPGAANLTDSQAPEMVCAIGNLRMAAVLFCFQVDPQMGKVFHIAVLPFFSEVRISPKRYKRVARRTWAT